MHLQFSTFGVCVPILTLHKIQNASAGTTAIFILTTFPILFYSSCSEVETREVFVVLVPNQHQSTEGNSKALVPAKEAPSAY